MGDRIVIYKSDGTVKGLYTGSLEMCLANVEPGERYEVVGSDYTLPEVDISEDANFIKAKIHKNKISAVRAIKVAVNEKIFDGDEDSQSRMLRAIQIASITNESSTKWKMADNSIVSVTLDELKQALSLAGKEMSKIWIGE